MKIYPLISPLIFKIKKWKKILKIILITVNPGQDKKLFAFELQQKRIIQRHFL